MRRQLIMPSNRLLLFTIAWTLLLGEPSLIHSVTLPADVRILQNLKSAIDPNTISSSSFIASWDFKLDPCESTGAHFLGILCTIPETNGSARIRAIDLDGVGYDGFLAKEIGELSELTVLSVRQNKFRGPIPDSIVNLTNLVSLDMSDNFFTGNMLPAIGNYKRIESINLSNNKLTGTIPDLISNYRSMVSLRLASNAFLGTIPNLAGLWQLNTLDMSNNQFNGTLPPLPINLRNLALNRNMLTGHITPVGRLTKLKTLRLSENRFTGGITREILSLPEVRAVNVSVNWLTEIEVPKSTGSPTHLQELDVHENHLRGRLPGNLVTIETLTSIDLSHNHFFGPIPRDYGLKAATSWRTLFLDHNYLVGALPPELNSTRTRTRGSLALNCLKCPKTVVMCNGGQRLPAECVGQDSDGPDAPDGTPESNPPNLGRAGSSL